MTRGAESPGAIKKLQGESGELCLRVGDYRVRFTEEPDDTLRIIPSAIARKPTA